jgi:diadenosine tetraphosphate (Ap4A) HIT family hydrolase
MNFSIDPRITSTCFHLADWSLSSVFLKNNANYPWLILVPREAGIQDMDQLPQPLQHTLMDEINRLSAIVKQQFQPDKLNVGTLGNIVSQLHIHVVARYTHDELWPHGIWQAAQTTQPYTHAEIAPLLNTLKRMI